MVIINASNLVKGGALQVASWFIRSTYKNEGFYYILSREVYNEVDDLGLINCMICDSSPAKSISTRIMLSNFINERSPLLVYTIFGPSYLKIKSKEICGFANGWVTHSKLKDFVSVNNKNLLKITKSIIKYLYYGFKVRGSSAIIFETETAQKGFCKRMLYKKNTYVIPNNCSDYYEITGTNIINGVTIPKLSILVLSSSYPHKNLSILPHVMSELVVDFPDYSLILTLPEQDFLPLKKDFEKRGVSEKVLNLGHVKTNNLADLYNAVSISLLPTKLETFSAVYPESMKFGIPIVTTNASFSRDICKDAALYFNPEDSKDIARKLSNLIKEPNLAKELIENGYNVFNSMPSGEERLRLILSVINNEKANICN